MEYISFMKFFRIFLFLFISFECFSFELEESFFVSLRSNEVNLRNGPGGEYPIKAIYQIKNIPLEVLGEYDNWYKVRDKDKFEGWVNKNLTSKKRTLIVINGTQLLYKKNNTDSKPIFRLEENVVVKYNKCDENWCKVEINNRVGWIESKNVWGQ